jgi:phage tail sheath protein FI
VSNFVSPGVYIREFDFSQIAPAVTSTVTGMVGYASRGPINDPQHITNTDDLIRTFGNPYPSAANQWLVHSALEFLFKGGRELWIVRVAGVAVASASVAINDAGAQLSLTVSGITMGTGFNGFKVTIAAGTIAGTFKLTVIDNNGFALEIFDLLKVTPTSDPDYVETRVNGISRYITVDHNAPDTDLPVFGTYTLAGGNDGLDGLDATVIGQITGNQRTGLQLFRDDLIDIQLLAVPGIGDKDVAAEMIDICAARKDAFAVLDPPPNLDPQGVVDYVNGTGAYVGTQKLDSSYGGIYWPWVKATDSYNRETGVAMPPCGFVLGVIAFTDFQTFPWFAPAGLNRGKLTRSTGLPYFSTQGTRDFLYVNNVNPVAQFGGSGICIWGQKTLQRTASALDRINVRRMMLFAEKSVKGVLLSVTFEPNDPPTWRHIKAIIESGLAPIKRNRGINEFVVVWDETTNTPDVIDRNETRGKVLIKPTHAAEVIVVDFILMRTGASFTEQIT